MVSADALHENIRINNSVADSFEEAAERAIALANGTAKME